MISKMMSCLILSAVTAGLLVGVGAATEVGAAQAADRSPSETADAASRAAGWAVLRPWRVSLIDGRPAGPLSGHMSAVPSIIAAGTEGGFHVTNTESESFLMGAASYQIEVLGKRTGYWIRSEVSMYGDRREERPHSSCDIYWGDPAADGEIAPRSPFTCHWKVTSLSPNGRVAFDVTMDRVAEASGSVRVEDDLALVGGIYRQDLTFSAAGASSVEQGAPTSFHTILTLVDKPEHEKQARTEWSYQIVDGDNVVQYWAAGLSTNHSGWATFNPDGRCAVYAENPLADGGKLDDHKPVVAPYACNAAGGFVHDDREHSNIHYDAEFTVSRTAG